MRGNPTQGVRFRVELLRGPNAFGKGTRPDPNLHMVDVLVAQLTPQADLSPQNILLVLVALHHASDVLVVQIEPGLVIAVGHSQIVTHSHIEVEGTVLRDDNLVFGLRQSSPPPLDDVSLLNLDVVSVHPIDKFLVGVQLFEYLVLLSAIVSLQLLLSDVFLLDELGLIG
jgi:hypothetical protein